MEALTEEKAKVHVNGLPEEAKEDEGCARAALADGTKVEVCEPTESEVSLNQVALQGESSDSFGTIARHGKKIFVGGLPYDLTIEEFRSFFESFGKINDAVIIPDPLTRMSRGFGFVTFDSKESVDQVLKTTTSTSTTAAARYIIKGKKVEVKLAIPKEEYIENRPIVNQAWLPPCEQIIPNVYGYYNYYHHHHFNAFTIMPGMPVSYVNREQQINQKQWSWGYGESTIEFMRK